MDYFISLQWSLHFCFPADFMMSKNAPTKTLKEDGIDVRQSPFDAEDCPERYGTYSSFSTTWEDFVWRPSDAPQEIANPTPVKALESKPRWPMISGSMIEPKFWLFIAITLIYAIDLKENGLKCFNQQCSSDSIETERIEQTSITGTVDFKTFFLLLIFISFVCRRHYLPKCRPLINRKSERLVKTYFLKELRDGMSEAAIYFYGDILIYVSKRATRKASKSTEPWFTTRVGSV